MSQRVKLRIYLGIVLHFGFVLVALANRSPFRFTIDKYYCRPHSDAIDCNVIFHNSSEKLGFDADIRNRKTILNPSLEVVLSAKTASLQYFNLLNVSVDVCNINQYRSKKGLVSTTIDLLDKASNITRMQCPMEPTYLYIRAFWLGEENFPSYTPEGQFMIQGYYKGKYAEDKTAKILNEFYVEGRNLRKKQSIGIFQKINA